MDIMGKYDIAIVGGGFAGTSLAYKLSKLEESLEIALIERDGLGGKPVSAFTFTDVIDDLDIKKSVRQYYNQIDIVSTLGANVSCAFDKDVFAFVDYEKVCKEMANRSGCEVIFEEVKSLKGGKVALKNDSVNAKVIVDASGWGYKFRKELNLGLPKIENHLYFKKLTNCNIPNPGSVQLVVGDIGSAGGWFYPAGKGECEIGVAERINKLSRMEKANISNREKQNMERFVNHLPYSEMLDGAQCESEAMVYYPYEPVKRVVKNNIVFLGDNAGMVQPIHGMGLHYINKVGAICAEYCAKAALGDITMLKEYQKIWNDMLISDMNTWIQGMIYWNLNAKDLNEIIEIQKNSNINKMNILSALRGHWGKDYQGDEFEVPLRLYLTIIKNAIIYKTKYMLKYRC
ncbi:MAG TPA: NAD(P)/FAD-dependent oxidoreductase [Candidatus Methanoperedens sp.]